MLLDLEKSGLTLLHSDMSQFEPKIEPNLIIYFSQSRARRHFITQM